MLELKPYHFEGQFLKSFQNDVVVILYKAEWCKFCQMVKPEYFKLSKLLLNKVIIATVDADECNEMIDNNNKFLYGYKVVQYPTIVIYKNGYFVKEYLGERKVDNMMKEILKIKN